MLNCLLKTHPRSFLVLQGTNVEGEGACLLLNLGEYCPRVFHFQLIGDSRITLINGRPRFLYTSLHRGEMRVASLEEINIHTLPSSPDEIKISIPYTSFSANVAPSKSRFWASLGFKMIRFLPSMTFWVCWHDSIPDTNQIFETNLYTAYELPSTGLQSHEDETRFTTSVTAQFLFPTLIVRIAISAACHAALTTSARLPVTGFSAVAPMTIVSALMAAKPSIWAPS